MHLWSERHDSSKGSHYTSTESTTSSVIPTASYYCLMFTMVMQCLLLCGMIMHHLVQCNSISVQTVLSRCATWTVFVSLFFCTAVHISSYLVLAVISFYALFATIIGHLPIAVYSYAHYNVSGYLCCV